MGIETLLEGALDALSTKPLYLQLTEQIKLRIRSGEIEVGDMLPSELELCDSLHISRSTVRQSMALLESEGFVVRRRGKGTFVSRPKAVRRLTRLCSFSKQMTELGIQSDSTVLSFDVVQSDDVPGLDGITGPTYKIVRLRETDGLPFMLDTVYLPAGFAPGLTKQEMEGASLYDVVEHKSGKTPHRAMETYEVVKLDAQQMQTLKTDVQAAFSVTRTSRTVSDELFEVATMLIRGDRCRLEAQLETDAVAFARTLQ